jgi:hypothetical protein
MCLRCAPRLLLRPVLALSSRTMPTTRAAKAAASTAIAASAGPLSAQPLVRFDSTRTELTPAAASRTGAAPTTTRSRATKRKVPHPEAGVAPADTPPPPPKKRTRAKAPVAAAGGPEKDASSSDSPRKGILRPVSFEHGPLPPELCPPPPTTFIQPPGDVSPEPETPSTRSEPDADALPQQPQLVPAVLSFSLDDAKAHLIRADARFADVFARMPCRPFENLERVDPFRTLVQSILCVFKATYSALTTN